MTGAELWCIGCEGSGCGMLDVEGWVQKVQRVGVQRVGCGGLGAGLTEGSEGWGAEG